MDTSNVDIKKLTCPVKPTLETETRSKFKKDNGMEFDWKLWCKALISLKYMYRKYIIYMQWNFIWSIKIYLSI